MGRCQLPGDLQAMVGIVEQELRGETTRAAPTRLQQPVQVRHVTIRPSFYTDNFT